nr:BV-like protein [Cotesia vestalis bracovirus]
MTVEVELADAIRCDGAFPRDEHSVKIDIPSGSQSCSKLSVAIAKRTSPKTNTESIGFMPPDFKNNSLNILCKSSVVIREGYEIKQFVIIVHCLLSI